jgi:hypothetical protein
MSVKNSQRFVATVALLLAVNIFTGLPAARGQLRDSGKKAWIVVKGSLKDFAGKGDTVVADFDSERDAKELSQRLNESLKGDDSYKWLFSCRRRTLDDAVRDVKQGGDLLSRLKAAKDAVDRAQKIEKGDDSLLKAKERTLGDTIREYLDMVGKSYGQAIQAKKTLTGGVAALTDAKMREVNGLIDRYNRELQDFQSVMGKAAKPGFSPLAPVQPFDPEKSRAEVVGTWNGTSVDGESKISIVMVFDDDGTVSSRGENGQSGKGTWTRELDTVNVTWSSNGARVSFQLKDGAIVAGGSIGSDRRWSVSIRKK